MGKNEVKLELWMTRKLLTEHGDLGINREFDWSRDCHRRPEQRASFGVDDTEFEFKEMSVRKIKP